MIRIVKKIFRKLILLYRDSLKYFKLILSKALYCCRYLKCNHFGKLQCSICGNSVDKFDHFPDSYLDNFYKHHFVQSIFAYETFNIPSYACPICQSSDSQRLYGIYLRMRLKDLTDDIKLVDFAPTKGLAKLIKSFNKVNYRSADLYDKDVDDKIDLRDMKTYKDNSFDMIVCTHVLEHIKEDQIAIDELYRILKSGGEALIQVPILLSLDTDQESDSNQFSSEDSWKYFGEATHVRNYSKNGFVEKLTAGGFKVEQLDVNYFGKEVFARYGIDDQAVLYISKK